MRLTKEALSIRVVVRRAVGGAAPFRWEVYRDEGCEPLHISPDRFRTMEAAYQAGRARLAEFTPARPIPSDVVVNSRWETARQFGLSDHDMDTDPDRYATPESLTVQR